MADSTDMIMPMLREMRAEAEARHGESLRWFEAINAASGEVRSACAMSGLVSKGEELMARVVARDFEARIGVLEHKVRRLEGSA